MKISNTTFTNNEVSDKDITFNNDMLICDYLMHKEIISYGGAISVLGTSLMFDMTNSSFINNTAIDGGSIYTKDLNTFNIVNSIFYENRAICGAGIFSVNDYFEFGNTPYVFEENTFESNLACKGGAMVFIDDQLETSSSNDETKLLLYDNEFLNNEAQLCGGIIHLNHANNVLLCCNCTADDTEIYTLHYLLSNESYCSDKIKDNQVNSLNGHGDKFSTDALQRIVLLNN